MARTKLGFKGLYLEYLGATQGDLRRCTVERRGELYSAIFKPYLADRSVRTITAVDIQKMLSQRVWRGRPLSPGSKRQAAAVLSGFFSWCQRAKLMDYNPVKDYRPPKVPKRLPKVIEPAEARALLQHLYVVSPRLLFPTTLVALYSGLRLHNLAMLDPARHIEARPQTMLFFPAEDMKNHQDFLVPVHPLVEWAVRTYFPLGFTKEHVGRMFSSATAKSGLRHTTMHWLRHTFCTWITRVAPWPVAVALMGHSALGKGITMLYAHATEADLRDGLARLPLVWDVPRD